MVSGFEFAVWPMRGIDALGDLGHPPVGIRRHLPDPGIGVGGRAFPSRRLLPRGYGLDVGWNRTAAIWAAQDPESGRIFITDEHYYAHADVGENARAIKARGAWIPGVVDPSARGRSQIDGEQLLQNYRDLGLDIEPAINTREAGIQLVREWMQEGMLKVFKSCANFYKELRLYRRDDKGRVVKENDHLLDALRYFMVSGRDRMRARPVRKAVERPMYYSPRGTSDGSWMG